MDEKLCYMLGRVHHRDWFTPLLPGLGSLVCFDGFANFSFYTKENKNGIVQM